MLSEVVTLTLTYFSFSFLIQPSNINKPIPDEYFVAHQANHVAVSSPTITPTQAPQPTSTPAPTQTPTPTIPPPTATPNQQPPASATPSDLELLFTRFSEEYDIDKELLKRIAYCESHYNSQAENGDYSGMFQFATNSWMSVRLQMGLDQNPQLRKNTEEAIKTAAYMVSQGRQRSWPSCI